MNVYIVFSKGMEVKITAVEAEVNDFLTFYGMHDTMVAQFQDWDYWFLKKMGRDESK